jgi:hypothetical protein
MLRIQIRYKSLIHAWSLNILPAEALPLHLALGAGLRTGAEQTLPPTSEADEQKLPHGRDPYKG